MFGKALGRFVYITKARLAHGFKVIDRAIAVYGQVEKHSVTFNRQFLRTYGIPLRGPIKARVFDKIMRRSFPELASRDLPKDKKIPHIREKVWRYMNWNDEAKVAIQIVRLSSSGGPFERHNYTGHRRHGSIIKRS